MADSLAPLILIVDDDPQSLKVMSMVLRTAGYRVAAANGGAVCFEVLQSCAPDLILCDVEMPTPGGFEVCSRLKADPARAGIPLIFLTGRSQPEDLVAGFGVGAVDYITKPFEAAELLARVKTHSELKRSRDAVLEASNRLESLNSKLAALNAEKDQLLGIVAHDLRNPIAAVSTAHRLLGRQLARGEALSPELLDIIAVSCQSAQSLIQELLEAAELEQSRSLKLRPMPALDFLESVVAGFRERMRDKGLSLELEPPPPDLLLALEPAKMSRALANLLHNALKFTPTGGKVRVSLRRQGELGLLEVADSGIGIPPDLQSAIFEKFTRARRNGLAGEQAHGLGMHIVREIVLQHGGKISLESAVNRGTRFLIELPLAELALACK